MKLPKSSPFAVALAAALFAAAVPAFGAGSVHSPSSETTLPGEGISPSATPVARDEIPLEMKTLEGRSVSLRDLRGEVVVLNFWATWCKPCITEMPVLAKLAQRFGSRGLRVIAASVDENATREDLARFAEKLPNAMEVWIGATMADIERMRVQSLPTTVIIDRAGSLIRVHHGAIPEGFLDASLEELLDSRGPTPPVPAPNPGKRFSEASEA